MTATTQWPTIYESDETWGDPTYCDRDTRADVESNLRECFGVDSLRGSWSEWEFVRVLESDPECAVYQQTRYYPADGKTACRKWFVTMRMADAGYFDQTDGGPTDQWE